MSIYGGSNFPFVTSLSYPELQWLGRSIIGAIALVIGIWLGGLAAIVWWLV